MKAPITVEERGNAAVAWHQGPKHKFYEDRYRLLCRPIPLVERAARGEIFAVCDGVGSAEMGMAAAQEVCSTLLKFYENSSAYPAMQESIGTLLMDANQTIHAWGMIDQTDRPIGACAGSVVWIGEDLTAHIFHVGDTTVLLIRDGTAQPQTTIHQSADGHLSNYFGQG
jgi:PPM family protein phosphatase